MRKFIFDAVKWVMTESVSNMIMSAVFVGLYIYYIATGAPLEQSIPTLIMFSYALNSYYSKETKAKINELRTNIPRMYQDSHYSTQKYLISLIQFLQASGDESVEYRVGAYIRLSSDDTKKRGDSLETQRNIIENYVAAESGIRIVEVYSDNNTTGTNFDRPGFQRMLADAQVGKINCIIVKDLSRFGRNAIDGGYYIEKHLPSIGVRFIAITDSFDSNDSDGGILLPIKQIINESYALDIGRKVRAVHQQNIKNGRYVGRLAPYGYKKDPDDCHKLIIEEETAPVVQKIFEWADEGVNCFEIARQLTSSKVTTPAFHNHNKGYTKSTQQLNCKYWNPRAIKSILADRVYVGDMVQGKSRTVGGKQIKLAPSEWICVSNVHEPIISRNLFDRVQGMRKAVREKAQSIAKKPFTPTLFGGKVLCSHCGYFMKRRRQNKDGTYWYRCESQNRYGKSACHVVSVKETEVYSAVLDTLRRQTTDVIGRYVTIEKESAETKDPNSAAETELREINRELGNTGRFYRSLYESLVDGLITPAEYAQMKSDYETKNETLSRRADEIRNNRSKLEFEKSEYYNIADSVSLAACEITLTAEIVDAVVEKIIVRHDKSFEVSYRLDRDHKEAV